MKHFRPTAAIASYAVLLLGFWLAGQRLLRPEYHFDAIFVSFALLLVPLWLFGFGFGQFLRNKLNSPFRRILPAGLLVIPYLAFAVPAGQFRWSIAIAIAVLALGLAALLELSHLPPRLTWQDVLTLAILVAIHLLRLLEPAWPPRLAALPKLLLTDILLYVYVVVRDLQGIGYSLVPTAGAFKIGLREWLFFLPFGIGLGTALHFTRFHPHLPSIGSFAGDIVLTLLFIAIPEELFFRGILQNLLETRLGWRSGLVLASVLFGLSHYHRGGVFDWRYILLAAIAGIFYGRAWRADHRLLSSIITHTAVDVVWSLWFR